MPYLIANRLDVGASGRAIVASMLRCEARRFTKACHQPARWIAEIGCLHRKGDPVLICDEHATAMRRFLAREPTFECGDAITARLDPLPRDRAPNQCVRRRRRRPV
jgi:hypothetical protein